MKNSTFLTRPILKPTSLSKSPSWSLHWVTVSDPLSLDPASSSSLKRKCTVSYWLQPPVIKMVISRVHANSFIKPSCVEYVTSQNAEFKPFQRIIAVRLQPYLRTDLHTLTLSGNEAHIIDMRQSVHTYSLLASVWEYSTLHTMQGCSKAKLTNVHPSH